MAPSLAIDPVPLIVMASGIGNKSVETLVPITLKVAPVPAATPMVVELEPVPAVALPNASLLEINTVPALISVAPA